MVPTMVAVAELSAPPERGSKNPDAPDRLMWRGRGGMYHQGLVATKQEVAQNSDNVN